MTEAGAPPAEHRFPVRVYYEDTDAGGVVYYANYLRFAERARTEMMREMGADHAEMVRRHGLSLAVRRCEIDYLRPAHLDDLLEVGTRLVACGGATLDAEQVVRRKREDLVRLRIRLACIGPAGRPARLPAPVRSLLSAFCQSQQRV